MHVTRRVVLRTRRVRSRVPDLYPLSDSEWRPVSSRMDSVSRRVDSVMVGLDELFIQLGESKTIFLDRRTTRRVVHMTQRVRCRLSKFLNREGTRRVDAILDE